MSRKREQRPPSRKEKRALREIQRAESEFIYPYQCPSMGEAFEEPTIEDMMQADEGNLRKGQSDNR